MLMQTSKTCNHNCLYVRCRDSVDPDKNALSEQNAKDVCTNQTPIAGTNVPLTFG